MFHICLYYTILSVHCSAVITCLERVHLLALLCVMFPCVFVTFPYVVSGRVWYLIVSIPDICLLLTFKYIRVSFQLYYESNGMDGSVKYILVKELDCFCILQKR